MSLHHGRWKKEKKEEFFRLNGKSVKLCFSQNSLNSGISEKLRSSVTEDILLVYFDKWNRNLDVNEICEYKQITR
jgi:hypothetical protein